jgi:hypothetical protein
MEVATIGEREFTFAVTDESLHRIIVVIDVRIGD